MKTVRIDGKDYEIGSEAHLDKLEQIREAAVKVEKDRADSLATALESEKAARAVDKTTHDAALKAEKDRVDELTKQLDPKAIAARINRGVRVQVLAAKSGVSKVTKDGKEIAVADAEMGAVLMAIAKKAMPDLDLAKLALTDEQLLELIAQKVGASAESAPAPTDGDMPAVEEEEEPADGRRGDAFEALARADGHGKSGEKSKKDDARSYEQSRSDMNDRVLNAWKKPKG